MSGQNMDRNTNQIEEEYEVQKVVDSKIENGQVIEQIYIFLFV